MLIGPAPNRVRQIWRLGIETFADVAGILAWRTMTIDAGSLVNAQSLNWAGVLLEAAWRATERCIFVDSSHVTMPGSGTLAATL